MSEDGRNSIFREKSLERINSPDQINDYIRVLSPSMWLILFGIIFILLAGILWGAIGRVEVNRIDSAGNITTESVAPLAFLSEKDL